MKVPYRIPTMKEIEEIPRNGYVAVSTFSGCGGSCLGNRMAGFDVRWASEFIPAAQETYRANHPGFLDTRDIREVRPEDILGVLGIRKGALDLFEGSPPCASFSTVGKREAGWGEVKKYSDAEQRTDDLFFEYTRLLRGLMPKVFVAENVPGLAKGVARWYLRMMIDDMRDAGYRVRVASVDASWLGVPQSRERLIFVGVREDLGVEPRHPKPFPRDQRYSLRDALPHIAFHAKEEGDFKGAMVDSSTEPSPTIRTRFRGGRNDGNSAGVVQEAAPTAAVYHDPGFHGHREVGYLDPDEPIGTIMSRNSWTVEERVVHDTGGKFSVGELDPDEPCNTITSGGSNRGPRSDQWIIEQKAREAADISRFAIGNEWDKIGPGGQSEKYFQLVRPDEDKPCPTITATGGNLGAAGVVHPTQKRKFTIAELKRICSFPEDFILEGSYGQSWERLGRSVPPLMMKEIALTVKNILDEIKAKNNSLMVDL